MKNKSAVLSFAFCLFLLLSAGLKAQGKAEASSETAKQQEPAVIPVTGEETSEKPKNGKFEFREAKTPLSGIVLTSTAYRGKGKNSIGTALDFNASYYIGRLYGKNTYSWATNKTNYLDRVGLWLLEVDGKMMIQTEDRWRPALASGVKGIFQFRDAAQPSLNSPSVSVKVDSKNTNTYASAYLSMSKRIHDKFMLNLGYADGDMPKMIYQMSEFLSNEAINLTRNSTGKPILPQSTLYAGFIWLFRDKMPIEAEIIIPQGAPLSPKLINLQLGTLLKLNFQVSYLTYRSGWEYLGMFNFRYSHFPKK
ncbi:MAG: hypothetical protein COT17_05385 [Elusimicrobia bacterium CG08_land_8_20_14_0_20_51_18]|nr:MAG: hypothetical protein COT17_05385 [Elusimicrobia bacterium CG08_land_8_20_14_0_20_51_18]